jgi:chromosome segregation ATPase
MRAAQIAVILFAGALVAPAALEAQQKEVSVAEAARRARAEKQAAAPAKRVWTNDNVPRAPGAAAGAPAAAAAEGGAAPAAVAPAGEAAASDEQAQERAKAKEALDREKANLARARREMELLQREYDLRRQQVFSNPNPDTAGRREVEQLGAQIEAKRQEAEQIEAKIAGLEQEVETFNRALGPETREPETPEEQRAAWQARVRPLREELTQVEGEIRRIRDAAAARGLSLVAQSGSPTAELIRSLENRRGELQRKIAEIEDEARRAGVPSAWVR